MYEPRSLTRTRRTLVMWKLVPVLAVLLLAGCKEPPPVAVALSPSGYAQGIDMARDARDYSQELKASHLDFVARYYRDPASRWPPLTAAEAQVVSAAGK